VVNVVITGGAGFLGSRLARDLLAAGSLDVAGGGARDDGRVGELEPARERFHDGEVIVVEHEPRGGRDGRCDGERDDAQSVTG